MDLNWLTEFSRQVRESSLKRFRLVQPEDCAWQPSPRSARFVDLLYHLLELDGLVFRLLDGEAVEDLDLTVGEADPECWDTYLERFVESGRERERRIAAYAPADLTAKTYRIGGGEPITLACLLLRRSLDHEIHHRGELSTMLRLRYRP